jgi:hypothetical protein
MLYMWLKLQSSLTEHGVNLIDIVVAALYSGTMDGK